MGYIPGKRRRRNAAMRGCPLGNSHAAACARCSPERRPPRESGQRTAARCEEHQCREHTIDVLPLVAHRAKRKLEDGQRMRQKHSPASAVGAAWSDEQRARAPREEPLFALHRPINHRRARLYQWPPREGRACLASWVRSRQPEARTRYRERAQGLHSSCRPGKARDRRAIKLSARLVRARSLVHVHLAEGTEEKRRKKNVVER